MAGLGGVYDLVQVHDAGCAPGFVAEGPFLDLLVADGFAVPGFGDVLGVDYVDADGGVHKGDFGAGPGGDEGVVHAVAAEAVVGEAEGLAEDDGDAGDGGEGEGFEEHDGLVEQAVPFRLAADDEARHVGEEDEGDVEAVAEADELGRLVAAVGRERAGAEHGVAGDDADGASADAGEGGDQLAPEAGLELEHAAAVDEPGDDAVHVVGALAAGGDEVGDARVGLRLLVVRGRREFPAVGGQVGEELLDQGDGFLLGVGGPVDLASAVEVDVDAAEVVEGDALAGGDFDDAGAGDVEVRAADLDDEVGVGGVEGGAAEGFADDGGGHRDAAAPSGGFEAGVDFGEALGAERVGQARAAGLAEVDEGDALAEGLVVDALHAGAADDGGGAVEDGDVVARGGGGAPVDGSPAADFAVAGRAVADIGLLGEGEGADFAEGAAVEEEVEALADGEAALVVLALDAVGGAHLLDDAAAAFGQVLSDGLWRACVGLGHRCGLPAARGVSQAPDSGRGQSSRSSETGTGSPSMV